MSWGHVDSLTLHPDSTTGAQRDLLAAPILERLHRGDKLTAFGTLVVAYRDRLAAEAGSGPNSSSKSSSKTVANSWFSTSEISAPQRNSPRIYSPSLLSSLPEPTDSEGTGRPASKSRKIRIYPDRHQRGSKLKLWFDAYRQVHLQQDHRTPDRTDGAPKRWRTPG